MPRTIFITGTSTGVGKTVLTALLLHHLRAEGLNALALKPFCSGSRADARLLHALQRPEITLADTNPYYFSRPLAPWIAAKEKGGQKIPLKAVLDQIQTQKKRAKILLIEGSGGLLAPLGDNYAAAELIARLRCETIIVASNSLGTINHTLLTAKHLQAVGIKRFKIVLIEPEKRDPSCRSNPQAIRELLPETPIFTLPFLGKNASQVTNVKKSAKKIKKTLALIIGNGNVASFLPTGKSDC